MDPPRNTGKLNIDKYNLLTTAQLQAAVDHMSVKHVQNHPLGCIETSYAYDKRPQMRIGGRKFYCAVITRFLECRKIYGNDFRLTAGFDASHYWCHNQHCVNSQHIHFEDHRVNKSRLYCRIYGMFEGFKCLHLPQCNICEHNNVKLIF